MTRSYGAKKPSRTDHRAAALGLLVNARVLPSIDTLIRSYGLRPADAEQMLATEQARRARLV